MTPGLKIAERLANPWLKQLYRKLETVLINQMKSPAGRKLLHEAKEAVKDGFADAADTVLGDPMRAKIDALLVNSLQSKGVSEEGAKALVKGNLPSEIDYATILKILVAVGIVTTSAAACWYYLARTEPDAAPPEELGLTDPAKFDRRWSKI